MLAALQVVEFELRKSKISLWLSEEGFSGEQQESCTEMGFGGEKKLEMETRQADLHGRLTEKLGFGPRLCSLKMIRWRGKKG